MLVPPNGMYLPIGFFRCPRLEPKMVIVRILGRRVGATLVCMPCILPGPLPNQLSRADDRPGHSAHGSAFDTGPRQRPWRMEGIGPTHFAVRSKAPEVQEWFNQGNTRSHSFWFEEAERSFRWCRKLDPDCAFAFGFCGTAIHLRREWQPGCRRIMRHTISTSIARTSGLPLLLPLPPRRLHRCCVRADGWLHARAPPLGWAPPPH